MTVRTIINVVLIDPQDTIRTLQMTVRTIINVVLIDPQDTIRTLQMTVRTIINVIWSNPQETIRTFLWGCIFIKWNSPFLHQSTAETISFSDHSKYVLVVWELD